jgi:radical SAM superfamily enzyme YgiQ (UPF0313 family)
MRKNFLFILNDNPIDPLGIMYLIGSTKANFDVVFVKDEKDERLNIDYKKYDYVGFSTITGSHLLHSEIAMDIQYKNPHIITIMGGPHPTFFPKEALELAGIDYICVGDGIPALNNFLHGKETKNIINDFDEYNGEFDHFVDVNKMIINREKIYNVDNRKDNKIRNFMGMWGCVFNCSYCGAKSYFDLYKYQGMPRLRFKSPVKFVNEIKKCVSDFDTKFLYFQDDTFIVNKEWFNKVTALVKKNVDLPYHCHVRCNLVTEDIIKQLKDTGCKSVTFAIENGDIEYRKKYLNRMMSNEQILNAADLLHKYDIKFRIENMVGLPLNSLQDNIETMKLNYKCKPTIGWASLFQPFPNTKLGNFCKSSGLWDGNINTINPSFFDTSPLEIENRKEVERLQKLFSLAVGNKIIYFLIPLLIRLPLDNIFKKIYLKYKNKKYDELYEC